MNSNEINRIKTIERAFLKKNELCFFISFHFISLHLFVLIFLDHPKAMFVSIYYYPIPSLMHAQLLLQVNKLVIKSAESFDVDTDVSIGSFQKMSPEIYCLYMIY